MTVNAEAVRAWLAARYDEDEYSAGPEARGWETGSRYEGQPLAWVQHVRRWSTDRVRREVAARRRRLERHRPFEVDCIDETLMECTYCHTNQPWPCLEIIDDAQAYADRADFPAELRLT